MNAHRYSYSGFSIFYFCISVMFLVACCVLCNHINKLQKENTELQAQVAYSRSADYFAAVPDSLKTCEMWRINDLAKENMKLKRRVSALEAQAKGE